ncbi:peptidase M48 [Aurantiacibacter xanthus]|uniref:Peptidase M48 n=1 Tax=Aurantiacibacter xanthus TaxID=1784712 RepID=A0A3A1P864_9SPHN|nr:M48 family metalloprotease [Aurantiacibacter xanthus]RIV85406.1 peptidase M48 [Aurantiacibacter xanthus]
MRQIARPFARLIAHSMAAFAALALASQPVAAQSVLRDAETEELLQDMLDPLLEAAGMNPGQVDVVLLNDSSINAFVAGGQRIYVHSGLINAADSANEVQGVLAHELGHITGGHINRFSEGASKATSITLLSAVLAAAAAAAGGGEAAMGVLAAGQQAAMGSFLAFSRVQEASADAASVGYIKCAGISGDGAVAFFRKLQNLEYRQGVRQGGDAEFARSHPLTGDRIRRLEETLASDTPSDQPPADLVTVVTEGVDDSSHDEVIPRGPATCRSAPQPAAETAALEARYAKAKAKLFGYLAEPARTLTFYPVGTDSEPAHYARAYAYHKEALVDQALAETDALIAAEPHNPYFLELRGQILLESGRVADSLPPLREATRLTGANPLIAGMLGHALIATDDPANLDEAEQVLRAAVGRDRENPFAWYQLGIVYGKRGDIPRARLASAEQQIMSGNPQLALSSAEAAEARLPVGSPDWLRAQDIALQARAQLERARDRS